jgi:aminoglycoside phosphotransferase family enzyme/predicted kinase
MEQGFVNQLLKPSVYPDATHSVTLIQTHISFLFLTDDYVYKIKKPVDLGFLNFTTLDRRRFYCEEEVRLNRRLCPDVYLGVVKIRESVDGVSFLGEGKIIEYAVKMRRLPEDRMLDRLLREDKVEESDIRRIAATIAEFHKNAERSAEIDRYGDISVIRRNWDENFRQVTEFIGVTLKRRDVNIIEEWVLRFISQNKELFAERIAGGFIRDCDGDIHAENICLENGIYIFDCIEFNERFRYIDTAADVAFLLMDFDYHDKRAFSGIFIEEYRALSGDSDIIRILDFYKIYRAFVRGKVESFKLGDGNMTPDEKRIAGEKAERHFRLARGYILREKLAPAVIIFSGLMGSGKSTLASELAFELGLDLVRSDAVRKKLAGIPLTERHLDEYGGGIYSAYYSRKTYESLLKTAENAITSGHAIILDASFRGRSDRESFRLLAQKHGVPFYIINTTCPEELIKQRLSSRILDAREPSDGRWELYYRQKAEYEDVAEYEGKRIAVDTSGPIHENLDEILGFLNLL